MPREIGKEYDLMDTQIDMNATLRSVEDPAAPADKLPRENIELRTLAFHHD